MGRRCSAPCCAWTWTPGTPYAIPPDNPFVGNPNVRDEIWAIGLRNPWRYSFDRQTGDLYIADVGQNVYEEVNLQAGGQPRRAELWLAHHGSGSLLPRKPGM